MREELRQEAAHPASSQAIPVPEALSPIQELIAAGLEPMYTLDAACWLIPVQNRSTLTRFLKQHTREFPAKYRGNYRMLSHTDILAIRAKMLSAAPRTMGRKPQSALEGIIERAMRDCEKRPGNAGA